MQLERFNKKILRKFMAAFKANVLNLKSKLELTCSYSIHEMNKTAYSEKYMFRDVGNKKLVEFNAP